MDAYSKGKWNLSSVPCPSCFGGTTFLSPPEAYNESQRLRAVDSVMNLPQWDETAFFDNVLKSAMRNFDCNGASISLIHDTKQIVKHQKSLGFQECPRRFSIDAHGILSVDFLVLLDASKDWRTSSSPFVKGVPHIKFYASVPLVLKDGSAIGCFSVFDVYCRDKIDESHILNLKKMAEDVVALLQMTYAKDVSLVQQKPSLLRQLGRATGGNIRSSSVIFEKDGSGNAYSQSSKFRVSDSSSAYRDVDPYVWKSLTGNTNIKTAAATVSRLIAEKCRLDLVYVAEIRVSELFQIQSGLFPAQNQVETDTFKSLHELQRIGEESVNMRIIGIYGAENLDPVKLDPSLHYKALRSEFGVLYSTRETTPVFKTGMLMPFFRYTSRLVRKKRISKNHQTNTRTPIDLFHRSGGYLVVAFNALPRSYTEQEVTYVFSAVSVLRRMFLMK
ncbi:unnamed protein product [Kuraishia capsulata CBS 1993]|uniref:GAF domain-containing protein n=1 Tax=Kuraishia capsulata CBS 1993 TaxID=1382522 RepID=W6MPU7_9ASCO|nr:uncharacterized protein KUCA_T00004660001 [Kuraishia capsulata CBS 1993]CDK28676.1 unnamed protein product [Kuraishia capsulata CBS 1993]